jgi:hypothetical protein
MHSVPKKHKEWLNMCINSLEQDIKDYKEDENYQMVYENKMLLTGYKNSLEQLIKREVLEG